MNVANLSWNEIRANIKSFVAEWQDKTGYEKGEAQEFLRDFFHCYGLKSSRVGSFEYRVKRPDGTSGFIDLLWKNNILIEMKSKGKNLVRAYQQATDYFPSLRDDELPKYILVCNFTDFSLTDVESGQNWQFSLKQLPSKAELFGFFIGYRTHEIKEQDPVNIKAALQMAKVHDALRDDGFVDHALDVYLVRLIFCFFADDTAIFEHGQFYDYLKNCRPDGTDLSSRIAELFQTLNTLQDKRSRFLPEELALFPYVNGGLFAETLTNQPYFSRKLYDSILTCCSLDWSSISPSIFGSLFQASMDVKKRRNIGAHFTSEANILKVIKPLFLDALYDEYEECKGNRSKLQALEIKLSKIQMMDPACGCGNFLFIAYRELRRLENHILREMIGNRSIIDISSYILVNIGQMYGIEYDDFAAEIAKLGLWLQDHMMNQETAEEFGLSYVRLPLANAATIVHGNALRTDWKSILHSGEDIYIFGNPPFVGKKERGATQKADMDYVFEGKIKNYGVLDYVCAWYIKALDCINNRGTKVAFVSTNSIVQGEQAPVLWEYLLYEKKVNIDFAYRAFVWSNQAKGMAHVHCVIVGFSLYDFTRRKQIYHDDGSVQLAKNINGYLLDAPNYFIHSQSKQLCNAPAMNYGSMPIDDGHLILLEEERNEFIRENPDTNNFIRPYMGGEELINNKKRWCLWLKDVSPKLINKSPKTLERLTQTRLFRESSNREATKKMADSPQLFGEIRQPDTSMLVVPKVSSEQRQYLPIGFVGPETIVNGSALIVPDADLYLFGVLQSQMHMAWMRTVAGRLEMRYQYSAGMVYNPFPFPTPTIEQREKVSDAAKKVLNAREAHSDCTLAELYSGVFMMPDLIKAHQELNRAVEKSYGKSFSSDDERVAFLFERYTALANQE